MGHELLSFLLFVASTKRYGWAVCSDVGHTNKSMHGCSYFDCVILYGEGG